MNIQSLIIWAIILFVVIGAIASYFTSGTDKRLNDAYIAYTQGEQASNVASRELAFNKALSIYKQLSQEYPPPYGSGALDYNIGNSYFELGQYAPAVLHYYKAVKYDPWNSSAWSNLQVALDKLHLSTKVPKHGWESIFSPSIGMSISLRYQLFFTASFVVLLLGSFYIWRTLPILKPYIWIAAGIAVLMLLSLFVTQFIEPVGAVVVKSTSLYRDAGNQYAKVLDTPLQEGLKIEVIEGAAGGNWVEVRTPEGALGYVPTNRIELL